jgi:hypothetical protein
VLTYSYFISLDFELFPVEHFEKYGESLSLSGARILIPSAFHTPLSGGRLAACAVLCTIRILSSRVKLSSANSLLLWDRVQIMVPWDGFRPDYTDRDHARALELIGTHRAPTDDEKKQVHELIEDFATRPLPEAFSYKAKGNPQDWRVYGEKLLPDTWDLLKRVGRAGAAIPGRGVPVTEPTGLSLLSILADCCAGQSLARVTDQAAAYGVIAGLLTDQPAEEIAEHPVETLAALTLTAIDTRRVPLSKLVSFREREEKSKKGYDLRALRHRYLDRLSKQASALATLQKKSDRKELERQFKQDMKDDLRDLRSELQVAAKEALFSTEFVVAVLGSATAASPYFSFHLSGVVAAGGGPVTVGGLLALKTKFVKSRREVLRNHPMAYLYELKGGLRI